MNKIKTYKTFIMTYDFKMIILNKMIFTSLILLPCLF